MYADHRLRYWPLRDSISEPFHSYDVDHIIEKIAVRDLVSRRLNRHHLLASDIYCRSTTYKPIRSWPITNRYHTFNTYRSPNIHPILPRPISPVELPRISPAEFPRISSYRYRPICCKNCHRSDFSYLNLYNREQSFFTLAQNYYLLQTDYEKFHTKKVYSINRFRLKQRWKVVGFILIFYFILKKNLRLAKQMDTYYQRDYRRLRFLELLTTRDRDLCIEELGSR
jgi:hypothetical protein